MFILLINLADKEMLIKNSEILSKIMSSTIIKVYDKSTVSLTMNDFTIKVMKKYGLKSPVELKDFLV